MKNQTEQERKLKLLLLGDYIHLSYPLCFLSFFGFSETAGVGSGAILEAWVFRDCPDMMSSQQFLWWSIARQSLSEQVRAHKLPMYETAKPLSSKGRKKSQESRSRFSTDRRPLSSKRLFPPAESLSISLVLSMATHSLLKTAKIAWAWMNLKFGPSWDLARVSPVREWLFPSWDLAKF